MGLDIRWPIGLMFTLIGVLLTGYGVGQPRRTPCSLGININLIWGIVLLVFGVLMLAGRHPRRKKSAVGLNSNCFHIAGKLQLSGDFYFS